ncbi:hypothetical protein JCM19379_15690 [Methyloparacoccus murrellii]
MAAEASLALGQGLIGLGRIQAETQGSKNQAGNTDVHGLSPVMVLWDGCLPGIGNALPPGLVSRMAPWFTAALTLSVPI